MISIQEKMLVAENCAEYKPKVYTFNSNRSAISQGCNTCVNYINDKCNKELFEQIEEKIRIN
ncbi:MAG: hypothetical protein F8N39_16580 [Clostridiaceae bacterium]|nr:hypothetical protein [Clostridiaceae bacterium]